MNEPRDTTGAEGAGESSTPATCFTIMPFTVRDADLERYGHDARHWDEVYRGLIVPAVERAGLRCMRDDEDSQSRLITEDIWRKIEASDVILCDMSSSNPNVFLELGWALRSDKRFVLIKDGITPFNFDLNQFFTFQYSHRLQPSELVRDIQGLSEVLRQTLRDSRRRYSIVRKMSLELGVIEASQEGNIEVSMLKTLLDEIRSLQRISPSHRKPISPGTFSGKITSPQELASWLVGTCWRKENRAEVLIFRTHGLFEYASVPALKWFTNEYRVGPSQRDMVLYWKSDNFKARCEFSEDFTYFVEGSELTYSWHLEWTP